MKSYFYLFAVALFKMVCAFNAYSDEGDLNSFIIGNLRYEIMMPGIEDSPVMVSAANKNITGEIEIPASINYNGKIYDVYDFGPDAFIDCINITSVRIPLKQRSGFVWGFENCSNLYSLEFYETQEVVNADACAIKIYGRAFANCSKLTTIEYPETRNIWLNNNKKYPSRIQLDIIGEQAFLNCHSLQYMKIPYAGKFTTIGKEAFKGCAGLTSIDGGRKIDGVLYYQSTAIESNAFEDCSNLTNIKLKFADERLFGTGVFKNCTSLTNIDFVEGLHGIPMNTFEGCNGLINLTIPTSIEEIGGSAFANCTGLKSAVIPEGVKSLGGEGGASDISWYGFGGVFYNCENLESITIPNTCSEICNECFSGCTQLKNINIPNTVTVIGNDTFRSCMSLREISIPESVQSIGNCAFYNCYNLQSLNLPNSIEKIYTMAFCYCPNLKTITIPSSIKYIGDGAFAGWNQWGGGHYLSDIYYLTEKPIECGNLFYKDTYETATLHCLEGYEEKYAATYPWSLFLHREESTVVSENFEVKNDTFNVYSTEGVCVIKNATNVNLNSLAPGIYIYKGKKHVIY
ncbi:MAG: leucine-rich repeat domain-containing protein [Muribaculum sp.]|nr:leucine-rich repeat domain-containing protein [Muribaculum sp.]